MTIETNIFPITNLSELSSRYVLYTIRGLNNAPEEYYQNCQNIVKRLSYSMRSPVTIINRDNIPFLVVEEGKTPPQSLAVIRTNVRFDRSSDIVELDYTIRTAENDAICQRFLDFAIQGALFKNYELWQPAAGYPFFEKQGESLPNYLVRYPGYSIRAAFTSDGQLGFCLDVTSKSVGQKPLPHHLTHDEFAQWKNRSFIYHYGHQWYEVHLTALSDFNASEYLIPGTDSNVLEWTVNQCRKPIPAELVAVPHDASVAMYLNNRNENRGALVSLCYPVYRTSDQEGAKQHSYTILPPHVRRRKIVTFVRRYLDGVPFGAARLQVTTSAASVEPRIFAVPDMVFGNNRILSVRSTPGTQHISLDKLGEGRLSLLRDKGAGFYGQKSLGRHYLILPQSVVDSFGESFTTDLKKMVADLFPHPYDPTIVPYNDRVPRTFVKQGNSILEAVRSKCMFPGYALVMIHHTTDRKAMEEDQLAAMVMRELRKEEIDIKAAVIHSAVGQECYELVRHDGEPTYQISASKRGKLLGYLRMVAINKILLNNERWPFVLSTKLHADLTIGLDVKHHTVGLVVVGKNGGEVNTLFKTSRQREKLTRDQTKAYLVEIIRAEAQARTNPIAVIVFQRDGRLFDTEREGAHEAIEFLKREGSIAPDATITILEIPKSSPVRLRLFDISDRNGRTWVENPQVGTYCVINDTDGYLCATGRAFPKSGTVHPLHVRRLEGALSLKECLEDIFYLTCLAWTRPDDATRYPITIKLNDRFLGEEASEYDANALDIDAILDEQEEMDASYE